MTENQLKRIEELSQYMNDQRTKHFYGKEESERSQQDIEIKEICTNVIAWCILIKENE